MRRVTLKPRQIVFPEAHTLDSGILKVYEKEINSYKGSAFESLNIFRDNEGDLNGSNCFAPIVLRKFLLEGTRLATMADLGRVIEIDSKSFNYLGSDTGLVLRTAGDSCKKNDFLAKDLAEQLKKRKIILNSPKVIYFDALDLRKQDRDSPYGLAYNLNERAALGVNIIDAPELMNDMGFKTINEKGIPVKDENGSKNLYTRQEGLSRFYLDGISSINSSDDDLNNTFDFDQVVVVSGENTFLLNFNAYVAKLKKTRDEKTAPDLGLYSPEQISKAMKDLNLAGWVTESLLLRLKE